VHVVPDICGWHVPHPCPPRCSAAWADHLRSLGRGGWDVVATSESYGARFAAELGAAHVACDPQRQAVPCRARDIRGDLATGWRWLHPVVRRGLTRKLVLVGAESSGTSTLARDLARRLGAVLVPEFGRDHSATLAAQAGSLEGVTWTEADFSAIAAGQERSEAEALDAWAGPPEPSFGWEGPWLVCDTDLLATAVWHERYLGRPAPDLAARAGAGPRVPTLYVLTSPEGVAFEQDGLRDGEHLREWMTGRFREVLAEATAPWIEVRGDPGSRVERVVARMADLPPRFRYPGAEMRTQQ